MQLLVRFDTTGYETWKAAYDGGSEDRQHSGVTQMQLWHDADTPNRVWGLYQASDREKARSHFKTRAKLNENTTDIQLHFLRTA
ncbi:hypothetical protein SAMN04490244_103153 [Tranquillimonas rosea]|uniref:Uncharacterized protein n=1 Tax=Tranquillimonas rosea TaxID=641238 RepID=A0A1H9SDD1_9RHOB|nr:hypothetical protein [Tranquillimonas rosea]SER83012.1 hypothetical protein SAMN04490244_103153 [Tranquillimonas rosea]